MSLIDKSSFEARSGSGCSNSDYQLCRTTCCGGVGVVDDELLDFYFDPGDLTHTVFIGDDLTCPFCGKLDWDFAEIIEVAKMPVEWIWAVSDH